MFCGVLKRQRRPELMRGEMLSILSDVLCAGTGRPFTDMSGPSGRASWRDGGVCGTTSRKRIGRHLWSHWVHGLRSASDKWESSTLAGVSLISGWTSCYINQYSINLNSRHGYHTPQLILECEINQPCKVLGWQRALQSYQLSDVWHYFLSTFPLLVVMRLRGASSFSNMSDCACWMCSVGQTFCHMNKSASCFRRSAASRTLG